MGHEVITERHIDEIPPISTSSTSNQITSKLTLKKVKLYDYDDIKKKFVFIDDNLPVYQKAFLNEPANHYSKDWHDCKIKYFIVPLYQRIYLEAYEAKNFILKFLLLGPAPIKNDQELVIRFYLSSSRSYKDNLIANDGFQENVKRFILSSALPKFIWVAELSNKALIKRKEANGLIILDATEANVNNNKPLLFAVYEGSIIELDKTTGKLEKNALPLNNFPIYENNLKVI